MDDYILWEFREIFMVFIKKYVYSVCLDDVILDPEEFPYDYKVPEVTITWNWLNSQSL